MMIMVDRLVGTRMELTRKLMFSFFLSFCSFLVTPAVSFQNKPISYNLLINPSSLFTISAETGEISLTRPIDYEVDQHRYLLLVRASEGQESRSSAAEVCVYVHLCVLQNAKPQKCLISFYTCRILQNDI